MHETFEIPRHVGAMILPGAVLFPGSLLPLFIFEVRYRKMLARTLESERMFGVVSTFESGDGVPSLGSVGVVRACVANDDGTSNLVLQGVSRVRFLEWDEACEYPLASVEAVTSSESSAATSKALRREILGVVEKFSLEGGLLPDQLLNILQQIEDHSHFADTAASCMVGESTIRQRLLEELDVTQRLEILAAYLDQLASQKQENS